MGTSDQFLLYTAIIIVVLIICVTVYHTMTDHGRLEYLKHTKTKDTERELERIRVLGPMAASTHSNHDQ